MNTPHHHSSLSSTPPPCSPSSVPLPPPVEQALQQLCAAQSLPPPDADARCHLARVGEESALNILSTIAQQRVRHSLAGFIAYLAKQVRNDASSASSSFSPVKSARLSPHGHSPVRSFATTLHDYGFVSSPLQENRIGSLGLGTYLENGNGHAASTLLQAFNELEYRKAFLILNYIGKKKLDDAISINKIRELKDLNMIEFESDIWNTLGQFNVRKEDRCQYVDWDSGMLHNYHCHVSPDGSCRFKGPYLSRLRTLFQEKVGDENVLVVKIAEEVAGKRNGAFCPKDNFAVYRKIAKEGIFVGSRRYQFFVFKDGGKEEKKKDPTSSAVKCYFVCLESSTFLQKRSVHEARCLFMHTHTVSSISSYMIRLSLILSKTVSLKVDFSTLKINVEEDVLCKDENGNIGFDKKGKPLIHTDGTGFVSEDIALKCTGNKLKGKCMSDHLSEKCSEIGNLDWHLHEPPLLMQIRLYHRGKAVKGTLLVNKQLGHNTISIRPSMIKVEEDLKFSGGEGVSALEVVNTSNKPKVTYLSRPLIALLSYGGVPNEFFLDTLQDALGDALGVFSGKRAALKVSVNHGDMDGFNAARMILSGIPLDESFLKDHLSILMKTEKNSLRGGKIPITDSYYLMGTVDPTRTLKSDEVCIILDSGQISGKVLVYRNPGRHFGDIHVLNATYVKDMESFVGNSKYGIFFPCNGSIPLAVEIADGDFDGDLYWVSRNPQLLKHFKPSKPWISTSAIQDMNSRQPSDMNSRKPSQMSPEELEDELIELWLNTRFQPSYTVGLAADSWQALMDRLLTLGVEQAEERHQVEKNLCQLVQIYYDALDAPKHGGRKIEVPRNLKAEFFPHYMEKDVSISYSSSSILGLIYDKVDSYQMAELPNQEILKLPCFDVKIPKTHTIEWSKRYDDYRREMGAALLVGEGKEGKNKSADDVINKYKQLLYGAAEFEEHSRSLSDIFYDALAIYHTTYDYAKQRNEVRRCGFAWKVAGAALCKLYAEKQREKTITCVSSVLKEIFS